MAKLSEHQIQVQMIKWARFNQKKFPQLRLLYAIPNGAKRTPAQANYLRIEGMRSGVWDLNLDYPAHGYHGLRIETKTPIGRLSENQKKFKELYEWAGYYTAIVRSLDEFIKLIEWYLK